MHRINNDRLDRLIIFSRYPIPGKTKTRLIPELGKAGAAELQRRLTEATFKTAQEIASCHRTSVAVCFEGGDSRKMRQWLGDPAIYCHQAGGNLGNRMQVAFAEAFQEGCLRVVLIGADIPGVTTDCLEKAFDALNEYDVVMGPSTDGGYWLVGMKSPHNIFKGMDWGSNAVLDQTISAAKRMGLKTYLLDPLSDIDTVDDLKQWDIRETGKRPYLSVVIPALNESANIEQSILSARDENAEVIVVDGGSSDDTVEKATAAGARVETGPRGRAVQQNRGAMLAQGQTLLFLHADTILPIDYVSHVFEALLNPKTVAGAFRFKTDLDRPIMRVAEFLTNLRSQHLKLPYGDQGLFIRKTVFKDLGGFPEVPIAEDFFLIRRAAGKGRIRIVPAEAVTSARRWHRLGVFRTTLINQLIVAGCYLGISPRRLAVLYRNKNIK